jgi:hypothetical protein
MELEPLPICLFILVLLWISYKLQPLGDEIRAFRSSLEGTSDLVSHIETTHNKLSTSCTVETNAWIDLELQRTKSALKNAMTMVSKNSETRRGVLAMMEAVGWAFRHKEAATTHKELLNQCRNTLLCIDIELALVNERHPRPPESFFQEKRTEMLVTLSSRVMKNANMYSGVANKLHDPGHSTCIFLPPGFC